MVVKNNVTLSKVIGADDILLPLVHSSFLIPVDMFGEVVSFTFYEGDQFFFQYQTEIHVFCLKTTYVTFLWKNKI